MTPEQFCYWLQGRVELQPLNIPSKEEWDMIGAHLQTVFRKVTPQVSVTGGSKVGDRFKRAQEKTQIFHDHLRRMQEQSQTVASPGWYQYPQNMC